MKTPAFEHHTCVRCGGSGRMPFSVYGGLCFKCNGHGYVLTKRGHAANLRCIALRSKPAKDLVVGDIIQCEIMGINSVVRAFRKVSKIELITAENCTVWSIVEGVRKPYMVGGYTITCEHPTLGIHVQTVEADQLVRVAQSAEQKAATLAQALEYQSTLTKSGTPKKSAKA